MGQYCSDGDAIERAYCCIAYSIQIQYRLRILCKFTADFEPYFFYNIFNLNRWRLIFYLFTIESILFQSISKFFWYLLCIRIVFLVSSEAANGASSCSHSSTFCDGHLVSAHPNQPDMHKGADAHWLMRSYSFVVPQLLAAKSGIRL